ncbi:MAG: hypothetical protein R2874_15445 [Desulfobacterales bacterium]
MDYQRKGEAWFKEKFLHVLTPITIIALLITLVLLFSFKRGYFGQSFDHLDRRASVYSDDSHFTLGYVAARILRLKYEDGPGRHDQ